MILVNGHNFNTHITNVYHSRSWIVLNEVRTEENVCDTDLNSEQTPRYLLQ
jgi:hypothetical protein